MDSFVSLYFCGTSSCHLHVVLFILIALCEHATIYLSGQLLMALGWFPYSCAVYRW